MRGWTWHHRPRNKTPDASTTATRCDFIAGRYEVIRELGGGGMKVVSFTVRKV
jgi:hypothetical protein